MSRVLLWFATAGLFLIAWSFGPFSPLPFVALLPLLLTSLALTAGRRTGWVVGTVVIAVIAWAVGYFAMHDIFDVAMAVEFGLCTLLYVVVPSPGGKGPRVVLIK